MRNTKIRICKMWICLQMADKSNFVSVGSDKQEESQNNDPKSSLEDFVTDHYKQQKVIGLSFYELMWLAYKLSLFMWEMIRPRGNSYQLSVQTIYEYYDVTCSLEEIGIVKCPKYPKGTINVSVILEQEPLFI